MEQLLSYLSASLLDEEKSLCVCKMIITPEIAGVAASAMGLLGLIFRKARCFARRVSGRWQYGVGFTDRSIVPEISHDINIRCGSPGPPIITGVSSDPTPLSSWKRALKLRPLFSRE